MLYANLSPQPTPQLSGTKIPGMLALHRRASSQRLAAQRVGPRQPHCLTHPLDSQALAASRDHPPSHRLTHSHRPPSLPLLPSVPLPPTHSSSRSSSSSDFKKNAPRETTSSPALRPDTISTWSFASAPTCTSTRRKV